MNTLPRLGLFAIGVLLSGCVVTRPQPVSWQASLQQPVQALNAISGTYANGYSGESSLMTYFWDKPLSPCPDKIQLRLLDQTRLEVTAIAEGAAPVVKIVTVEINSSTGGVKPPSVSHVVAEKGGGGWVTASIQLFKGSDGRLYGHTSKGGVAAFAWVIPVVADVEKWRRWAVVP